MSADVIIRRSRDEGDIDLFRVMAREYAEWLAVDLCFQDFDAEMAGLPGVYAEPEGCILLAFSGDNPAGCVALKPIGEDGVCEMKRLWIRPGNRGLGLGRKLAEAIVEEGRNIGYREMRLDTLGRLEAAISLYRDLGFTSISPYYHNPLDGVQFYGLKLT